MSQLTKTCEQMDTDTGCKVEEDKKTNSYVDKQYAYWRLRITYSLIIGYAAFYCVRQNFSLVAASKDFPFDKKSLGLAFASFSIIYGVFKFVSGLFCDRTSARYFMPIGLIGASIVSFIAGFSNSAFLFGLMYTFNACFQSMGWPPVARSLTQWFGPKELGTRWGIVNASHQIGSVLILTGGAWLTESYSWRHAFIVPSILCLGVAFFLIERLRDNPKSLGLPTVEEKENIPVIKNKLEQNEESMATVIKVHILCNKRLWLVSCANFFVYFVRMGFFFWAPRIIAETRNAGIVEAGSKTSVLELAGLFGGVFAGWFTDKFMHNRRGLCGTSMLVLLSGLILFYWLNPPQSQAWDATMWAIMGFLIYGPQTLGGLSGAEFGSRKAAAAAAGITGTVGYLGSACVGVAVPEIADAWGWHAVFISFLVAALLGGIFFALTLKPKKA